MSCSRKVIGAIGTETHSLTESTGLFTIPIYGQSQILVTTPIANVCDSHDKGREAKKFSSQKC